MLWQAYTPWALEEPLPFGWGIWGLLAFQMVTTPKQLWGLPAGVSRHKQNCLGLFCCVEIAFLGVTSEGAPSSGALFPSCLLNMAQAGGPGSEPLCPGNVTFIKRLFSSSSLSAIRVVSSAYLS